MKKRVKMLHKRERTLWVVLIVCTYLLFTLGIDIEYLVTATLVTHINQGLVMILMLVSAVGQYLTINELHKLESEDK